jgi:hypothetical protein
MGIPGVTRRPAIVCLIATSLLCAGCASGRIVDGVYRDAAGRFQVGIPSAPWRPTPLEGATLAFRLSELPVAMALRVDCDAPEPGETLWVARHLFFGLQDKRTLRQEPILVAGSAGLRSRVTARLDGRPVEAEGITVRRGGCLADFMYVAAPERFAAGQPGFETFVHSFGPVPAPNASGSP